MAALFDYRRLDSEHPPRRADHPMMIDPKAPPSLSDRILDPMDRISEVLFGLIMALTFTLTLAVATADHIQIWTMLIGALGCNLAWGIIDGGVYLMARLNQSGRAIVRWRTIRDTKDVLK